MGHTPVVYATRGDYIDAANCGSLIAYRIYKASYEGFCAHIELTDCNRKIEWDFSGGTPKSFQRNIWKIEAAIAILKEFQVEMTEAYQLYKKAKKKKGGTSDGQVGSGEEEQTE